MPEAWKTRLLHRVGRELGPFVPAGEFDRAPRFHQVEAELRQQIALLRNELLLAVHDVRVELSTMRQTIGQLQFETAAARQSIEPLERFETIAKLGQLQNDVQRLDNRTGGLEQHLAETRVRIDTQTNDLRTDLLRQRRLMAQGGNDAEPANALSAAPAPHAGHDFAASLAQLADWAPRAFALWEPRLLANEQAYDGFPLDSCSVEGHPLAESFGCFLAPLLQGAVLDLGCGPQPVPSYLRDYPLERIAGVDPLLPPAPHPFLFHHGVAEILPWNDGSFQTVLAATSLDHVLLLDRTLAEIHRVLVPGGRFATWITLVPGAPAYDPHADTLAACDEFHLFHFDRDWFETLVQRWFRIDEVFRFDAPYDSAFYSLAPR